MAVARYASAAGGTYVPVMAGSDPAWIAALRARDEDAWRALHDREFPFLYRFALGMGADAALAEDAASEAFTRLVRSVGRLDLDSESSLRAWLLVVCRNYLRDQIRRTGRVQNGMPDHVAPEPALDTRLALNAAIARLAEAQREVIVLRFMNGLPTKEVAALTKRGVEAVESLQHRALGALRRALGPEWEDA